MKTNKSFQTPSAKPVDVQYRLKRLRTTLSDASMFLTAIDPSVFPDQYGELALALAGVIETVNKLEAPSKKPRRSIEEKTAAAAAKQLAKEEAAQAREAAKAAKAAEKAAQKPAPKAPKAPASKPSIDSIPVGTGSAIERALAAAKARKAMKVEAA